MSKKLYFGVPLDSFSEAPPMIVNKAIEYLNGCTTSFTDKLPCPIALTPSPLTTQSSVRRDFSGSARKDHVSRSSRRAGIMVQ